MTNDEFKEYVQYKTAESIKNTEARFEYFQRNIELSNQMIKEKEELWKELIERHNKIPVQLKLFDDERSIKKWELYDIHFSNYVLREPCGVTKIDD